MTCSALLLVLASSSSASTIPVIVCPPGLKEVPASIRHLCVALLAERDTPPEEGDIIEAPYYSAHPADTRGVKRQDVDHVFLRFGRRNGL